jgi:hypothetical protein
MLSKIIGSNNKLNNALATIIALSSYKHQDFFTKLLVKKANEHTEEKEDLTTQLEEVGLVKEGEAVPQAIVTPVKTVPTAKPVATEKKAPAKKTSKK